MTGVHDRRHRRRVRLAYQIRLLRAGDGGGTETRTENITCDGFYCRTELPYSPGEQLDCELVIPGLGNGNGYETLILRCRVEVVRSEAHGLSPGYGVGCRLLDYSLQRALARGV